MEYNKKLVLKNGAELNLKEFNTKEGKVSITLLDM